MRPFNLLISSAGRRVALQRIFRNTLQALGLDGRLLATDMSRLSSAFHDADAGFLVPRCTSPEFIPAMLEICRKNEVRLVVPTIDTELPALSAHREAFEAQGTSIGISSPEVIAIAGGKDQTHRWLTEKGFPTVHQAPVTEVLAEPARWTYPLLVKPRGGSASIGVRIVEDQRALEVATRDGDYIAQTLARGIEHTVDVLATRDGRCLCAIPRRRLEVRAGEVSKGMTFRQSTIIDTAWRICEALPGAYGTLNIQMFWDEATDEVAVIEINPRFGGGFPLAWQAGGYYPRWMIEEILGQPSTACADEWQDRLVMLRFDDAVFVDGPDAGF